MRLADAAFPCLEISRYLAPAPEYHRKDRARVPNSRSETGSRGECCWSREGTPYGQGLQGDYCASIPLAFDNRRRRRASLPGSSTEKGGCLLDSGEILAEQLRDCFGTNDFSPRPSDRSQTIEKEKQQPLGPWAESPEAPHVKSSERSKILSFEEYGSAKALPCAEIQLEEAGFSFRLREND